VVYTHYAPATATNGEVTVTLTLNETGSVTESGWQAIDCVSNGTVGTGQDLSATQAICRQTTYTGNITKTVAFTDLAGNT
jgi:hypothetical protein